MLRVEGISASYGDVRILRDVSFAVGDGEFVAVVGANGAGKSTLMKTIVGMLRPVAGSVHFDGTRLDRLPMHRVVAAGVALVPEDRRLFPAMTVYENLLMGSYSPKTRAGRAEALEQVFATFPVLRQRRDQLAGTLSGGEQQMVAIARGLMSRPRLLMLDEPSLGLSPLLVKEMFAVIKQINAWGTAVLLVEQNVQHALRLAERAYVLETGQLVLSGRGEDLLHDEHMKRAYLGM